MAINWDMYADSGRNVASGLGSLMDLGGISAKAKNRAALDQKFSSLASLGSPETGAMTGLPLRAERDRQPTGPAPEQFAGNPQPAQQFDGPMGGFSNKDLIEIIRNPEASDGERAMVLDEYKRRTTPKDPYAEEMKRLELERARFENSQLGKVAPTAPKWGVVGQNEFGVNQYGWIDEASRTVSPMAPAQGGQPMAGGASGASAIPPPPPGVNPKIWQEEYSRALAGKLTETQSKDKVYYDRGAGALERFEKVSGALASGYDAAVNMLPGVGNYLTSQDYQLANQAGLEFLASILRKDTGAAVTADEVAIYGRTFLPQPGDSAQTQIQKAQSRREALEAIRGGLGAAEILARARPNLGSATPPQPATPGTLPAPPAGMDANEWSTIWNAMTPEERALFQ